MATNWQSLSSSEIRARLIHRGCDESLARELAERRSQAEDVAVIEAVLGEE